jgi:hypothetical protein
MTIKIPWPEFVALATAQLRLIHSGADEPQFKKDYGCDGIGDMYDFPSFVEYELKQ